MSNDTEFVSIPKEYLMELEASKWKLHWLEIYGVDNWEGYGLAMENANAE